MKLYVFHDGVNLDKVHLVGFIIEKFVTMHGHMNGKDSFPFLKWHTVWTFSATSF